MFRLPKALLRLLQSALPLPKIVSIKPYALPLGAREGNYPYNNRITGTRDNIPTHSPYDSPVWPVHKPNGKQQLTIDYWHLNANTGPLTAAVPNIAELIATIQEQAPKF